MRELVKELEERHGWEVDDDFLDNNEEFLEALVEIARTKVLKQRQSLSVDSVSFPLPTDIQIEETADIAYKHVRERFPINDEYCYTQGYIGGMTALRNNIQGNEA